MEWFEVHQDNNSDIWWSNTICQTQDVSIMFWNFWCVLVIFPYQETAIILFLEVWKNDKVILDQTKGIKFLLPCFHFKMKQMRLLALFRFFLCSILIIIRIG